MPLEEANGDRGANSSSSSSSSESKEATQSKPGFGRASPAGKGTSAGPPKEDSSDDEECVAEDARPDAIIEIVYDKENPPMHVGAKYPNTRSKKMLKLRNSLLAISYIWHMVLTTNYRLWSFGYI
jgi:hypothetical protein